MLTPFQISYAGLSAPESACPGMRLAKTLRVGTINGLAAPARREFRFDSLMFVLCLAKTLHVRRINDLESTPATASSPL